jgi:hypothetical protein
MKSSELNTYWFVIRVDFAQALSAQDAERHGLSPEGIGHIGYFQKLGVTQSSEESARKLVAEHIPPIGNVNWDESVVSRVDVARLVDEILARSGDWDRPGVWYETGKILFEYEDP